MLRGRKCQFFWGEDEASWDRIARDALLLQLSEERERLQAALEPATFGSVGTAGPFLGELEVQLADCDAQMKEVLVGPCTEVSATALVARLLKEQLPLAPVTLYAAAHAVEAEQGFTGSLRHCQGQVMDHVHQQQDLKGMLGAFVRFPQALPASPNLIHITAAKPCWTLRLKEISERGMTLQILPLAAQGWKDCAIIKETN